MAIFTKKDIQRARERNALTQAKGQLGKHITSLKQVKIVNKTKPMKFSLGINLQRISQGKKRK